MPAKQVRNQRRASQRDFDQLWGIWSDRTVDGLHRRLVAHVRRRFPVASRAEDFAEDMVAEAFDSAVNALLGGTKIKNFPAWFYKTVRTVAAKRIKQAEDLFESGGDIASALHPGDATLAELEERERRDARLKERAIAHAAALAPRVGTGQVREVFDLFMEAVRSDVPDYGPGEIAEVMGISIPQARTLLHRALGRLRSAAEGEGIELPAELDPAPHEPYGAPLNLLARGEEGE